MLSIGKFAAAAGIGVETVRFYQRKGLLEIPAKHSGMRRYGKNELRQLMFIRKAQAAGFTLKEIKELISLDSGHNRDRAHELALSRIKAIEDKIVELQQARDALKRLAVECSEADTGPCPILESFEV